MYLGFVHLFIHRKSLLSNYSVPTSKAHVLVRETDSPWIKESVCNGVSGCGLNTGACRWRGGDPGRRGKARQPNVVVPAGREGIEGTS